MKSTNSQINSTPLNNINVVSVGAKNVDQISLMFGSLNLGFQNFRKFCFVFRIEVCLNQIDIEFIKVKFLYLPL